MLVTSDAITYCFFSSTAGAIQTSFICKECFEVSTLHNITDRHDGLL